MLFSCKSQRNMVAPTHEVKQEKSKENTLLEELSHTPKKFKTLSSKLSIEFEGNAFSGTMRMVSDSAIWLSLGKFGIEGVRALLTKDSVMILNRLSREYFTGGYEFIYDFLGFSVNYNMLQAILLGNDFQNYEFNNVRVSIQNSITVYDFDKRQNIQNPISFPTLSQKILYDNNLNVITRNYFEVLNSKEKMDVYYSTYLPFNNVMLPQVVKILMFSKRTYNVNLKFDKHKLNDNFDIPFSIPKSYTKISF